MAATPGAISRNVALCPRQHKISCYGAREHLWRDRNDEDGKTDSSCRTAWHTVWMRGIRWRLWRAWRRSSSLKLVSPPRPHAAARRMPDLVFESACWPATATRPMPRASIPGSARRATDLWIAKRPSLATRSSLDAAFAIRGAQAARVLWDTARRRVTPAYLHRM